MSEIKKSIDSIKIPDGAEERMYSNILKKNADEKAADKKINMRFCGMIGAAACIAVICTAAVMTNLKRQNDISVSSDISANTDISAEITEENTADGGASDVSEDNPFANDYSLDDIAALGINFTLPKNAEFNLCVVYDSENAEIRFIYREHMYYYSVSGGSGDFSGVYGSIAESETISEENGAVLDVTSDGYFKAHWSGEKFNYYLCNTDAAPKEDVIDTVSEMVKQAQ